MGVNFDLCEIDLRDQSNLLTRMWVQFLGTAVTIGAEVCTGCIVLVAKLMLHTQYYKTKPWQAITAKFDVADHL